MRADIIIHPFGKVPGDLLEAVRAAIERHFGVRTSLGRSLALPKEACSPERGQYRAQLLLEELAKGALDDGRVRLGIATIDLFAPELNFVFGEASSAVHAAVFSIARLDPRRYGEQANEKALERRAITEATHELGHVFGLGHCQRRDCVMWFSNTRAETDRKGNKFCEQCARCLGPDPEVPLRQPD
jgi:archaemetzincin